MADDPRRCRAGPGRPDRAGFCGNGFTLGTLSALMARDRFLRRDNPWFTLLAVNRSPFHGGAWRYVQENADFPYYFVRDRLRRPELESPGQVGRAKVGSSVIGVRRSRPVATSPAT